MNRRDFAKSIAATAGIAALPLPSAGLAALDPKLVNWAKFITRVHNKASVKMFQRHFLLDKTEANRLFDRLLASGHITAPDHLGRAKAVAPFMRNLTRLNGAAGFTQVSEQMVETPPRGELPKKALEKLDRFLGEDSEHLNQDMAPIGDDTATENPQDSPSDLAERSD